MDKTQRSVSSSGPRPNAPAAETPRPEGVRETIESIIVAFILAFVFRAFVVEAFVIPTGSMAPGLYGKHGEHRCAACGYHFAYGLRETIRLPDGRGELGTLEQPDGFRVECPNCGYSDLDERLNATAATRVTADSGDRILVLKWPYDLGGELLGPQRWDVVVFKDPQDGDTNYIKRLLGLPGEVVQLVDGDLYAAPLERVPPDIVEALSRPPKSLDEGGNPLARRLSDEQARRLAKLLTIRRKTRVAQESLWMVHYDHDYPPNRSLRPRALPDEEPWNPPVWRPKTPQDAAAWDASNSCVRFTPQGDAAHWLQLTGKPIQDDYGYNNVFRVRRGLPSPPVSVGDVRLSLVVTPGVPVVRPSAAGQVWPDDGACLTLLLRKGTDEFRATIGVDGGVRLDRFDKDGIGIPLQTGRIEPLRVGEPLEVEFENLDYRVALRVNGEEVVATDDEQYRPDLTRLLFGAAVYRDGVGGGASVEMAARGVPLEIRHLKVCRDVYYRSSDVALNAESLQRQLNPFFQYPGWGVATNPLLLRRDPPDYFCCGDNSPQSKDSRLWWEVCSWLKNRPAPFSYQYGTVPGDQMIGRAFFVYWPSGLRITNDMPAVIPNVGRMRIIR